MELPDEPQNIGRGLLPTARFAVPLSVTRQVIPIK